MLIGIIPNITKHDILKVVTKLLTELNENGLEFLLSKSLLPFRKDLENKFGAVNYMSHEDLCDESDIVISIGGDGTMLNTAYDARNSKVPMLGLNFGKLGFLAEFDVKNIEMMVQDLKNGNYTIEERITLEAYCHGADKTKLFAINDIVIDKGPWPKMIELTIRVDDNYVSTFSSDGVIIATPTGSTGYSLSTGGPIVTPSTDVITMSPISPHTLTMRPLVISSNQKIQVDVNSRHTGVQVNCDGNRVHYYEPPITLEVYKKNTPFRLVHSHRTNYFEILRNKLYWGLDARNNSSG